MVAYTISPYAKTVESRLIPGPVQHGIFHRLTGNVFEISEGALSWLASVREANGVQLDDNIVNGMGTVGAEVRRMVADGFLIPVGHDPLAPFIDMYVVRPVQNPALAFRSKGVETIVARTTMSRHVFSPRRGEMPAVVEETLPEPLAQIFLMAEGTKTLREIAKTLETSFADTLKEKSIREAVDFLTDPERQLIKFAPVSEQLGHPYMPFNLVPRDLYHSSRWEPSRQDEEREVITDFHLEGIEDAAWEFDIIEPTLNHAFRFPDEMLGGLDYGSRFCVSTLKPEVLSLARHSDQLKVLEVGGGTGTFARSFIEKASSLLASSSKNIFLEYHIADLSPALIENQKRILSELPHGVTHFHQNATELDIPDYEFDLIIANEVIADFPVGKVRRVVDERSGKQNIADKLASFEGEGAYYIERYGLPVEDAPDSFLVNAGVFKFIERAWEHLAPGGAVIMTEYGGERRYPELAFQLNHEEYSIHFGHAVACAAKVGFECRLMSLKDFLEIDDRVPVLDGHEEHLLCLNHLLNKWDRSIPFAAISEKKFREQFQELAERIGLVGQTFSPLNTGFHFGPAMNDFMALILNKPRMMV